MSTTTQTQFKIGQRVKNTVKIAGHEVGTTLLIRHIDSDGDLYLRTLGGEEIGSYWSPSNFQRAEITLEALMEGDKVVDEDDDSDKMVVLHVLKPGLYVMSEDEDGDTTDECCIRTVKDLENSDYIPLQPEAEAVEMTVAQAAEKMGIDPSKLKIVEG